MTITFGCAQNGLDSGSGSVTNTSSEAASSAAVVERGKHVRLVLQAAAPGIDQHRPAQRAVVRESTQQRGVDDAGGRRRQRQQHHEDIGAGKHLLEPGFTRIGGNAIALLGTAAPAGHLEAHHRQLARGIEPELAEAEDADPHAGGRRLVARRPAPGPLVIERAQHLAMVKQHVQHDIFRHAHGEVGVDHAHQRHVGQAINRRAARRRRRRARTAP